MTLIEKVPFDPGFSQFTVGFPKEVSGYLDEITSLKQNHQKIFAFSQIESQIVPMVKICTAFYLGCILWGSYLFWKYKNDIREIEGNPVSALTEEEINNLEYSDEIDFILGFINKLEKSAKFYLKRSFRIPQDYVKYLESYKQFIKLNDDFKKLKYTNEIKLPAEVAHFENFDELKLDELQQRIHEAINTGFIENLLNLGFYI